MSDDLTMYYVTVSEVSKILAVIYVVISQVCWNVARHLPVRNPPW